MDPKKKALTPELKQIYDRVMNTQVAPKPAAQPAPADTGAGSQPLTTPQTLTPPGAPAAMPPPPQSTEAALPPIPGGTSSAPIPTVSPVATPPIPGASTPAPSPTIPTTTPQGTLPPPSPAEAKNFLSSVPPRPVSDTGAFVFTGNKVQTPEKKDDKGNNKPQAKPHPAAGTGDKKISMPIIIVLVVVLVVVWGIFWAKILGIF